MTLNASNDEPVIEYFQAVIAGKRLEVECRYRDVFLTCRNYLQKFDTPDLVISVSDEELQQERLAAELTDRAEGLEDVYRSNPTLETLAVYRKLSEALLDEGFLLFHAAAIASEGKCYLFMARSGTGKTTHIKKWLELYPETFVVNGDKPLVDAENGLVWGTPWCGKERMGTNCSVPLGGLIWLERGAENSMEPIPFSEILPCILHQCHIPRSSAGTVKVMRLLNKLSSVPCWHLRCNMDPEAGHVSYRAVHGI